MLDMGGVEDMESSLNIVIERATAATIHTTERTSMRDIVEDTSVLRGAV